MKVETSASYINLNGMQLDNGGRFRIVIRSVTNPDSLGEYEECVGFLSDTQWPAPNGLGVEEYPFQLTIPVDDFNNALRKSSIKADLMKRVCEKRGAILADEIRNVAIAKGLDLKSPINAFLLAEKLPVSGWNIVTALDQQGILAIAGKNSSLGEYYVVSANPQHGLLRVSQGQLVAAF